MPIKSKAVVFVEPLKVELWDIDLPDPGPEDIVGRMIYSGISGGTEGWILRGKRPEDTKFPCVPGYQQTAEVVEVGSEVKGINVGDIVNLWNTKLPSSLNYGWGAHTEYTVQNFRTAVKVPADVPPKVAALAKLFAVGYLGVRQTGIMIGDLAVVIGLGLIGQGYAQIARLSGARVIGTDILPTRRELAAKYSCDKVVEPDPEALIGEVLMEKPEGADIVVEAAGKTELIDNCIDLVRQFGKVVLQGWYPGKISFNFHKAHTKRITMIFPCSLEGESEVLRLISEKKLILEPLITHIFPASEVAKAWDLLLNQPHEAMGVVLSWR
jgi:2-desacetyl-2-hydroxyethyl bacteriochlorophyllide A dehydrogenase